MTAQDTLATAPAEAFLAGCEGVNGFRPERWLAKLTTGWKRGVFCTYISAHAATRALNLLLGHGDCSLPRNPEYRIRWVNITRIP